MENTSEGPTFCGGFTYSLVYVTGPLANTNPLSVYNIKPISAGQHEITGTLSGTKWIGRHKIRLQGTLGSDLTRLRQL